MANVAIVIDHRWIAHFPMGSIQNGCTSVFNVLESYLAHATIAETRTVIRCVASRVIRRLKMLVETQVRYGHTSDPRMIRTQLFQNPWSVCNIPLVARVCNVMAGAGARDCAILTNDQDAKHFGLHDMRTWPRLLQAMPLLRSLHVAGDVAGRALFDAMYVDDSRFPAAAWLLPHLTKLHVCRWCM